MNPNQSQEPSETPTTLPHTPPKDESKGTSWRGCVLTLDEINSMDGHDFEELIESLFIKMGYRVEGHKTAADGGVDITAFNYEPFVGGKYIIQCKRQTSSIGEPVVRDLYGVVTDQKANKGIVVTNSEFTTAAIKFAEGKPIELVNNKALLALLGRYYSIGQLKKEKQLAHSYSAVLKIMSTEIGAVKTEYEATNSGAIFRQGKHYKTQKGYLSYASGKSHELERFTRFLGDFFKKSFIELEGKLNADGFDGSTHVKQIKQFTRESLKELLQSYRDCYYVRPPSSCRPIHTALINVYGVFFDALFYWQSLFETVVSNPEKYVGERGELTITLDYPDRGRLLTARDSLHNEVKKLTDPFYPLKTFLSKIFG